MIVLSVIVNKTQELHDLIFVLIDFYAKQVCKFKLQFSQNVIFTDQ